MGAHEERLIDWLRNLEDFRWTIVRAADGLLRPAWPRGRNASARDGGHWMLVDHDRPVSVSTKEAFVLALLVADLQPSAVVEVGSGFGYSAAWLAAGGAVGGG